MMKQRCLRVLGGVALLLLASRDMFTDRNVGRNRRLTGTPGFHTTVSDSSENSWETNSGRLGLARLLSKPTRLLTAESLADCPGALILVGTSATQASR